MSDFTPHELERLTKERQETRLKIKKAYQIAYNNPFRQQVILDPAAFRYEAARAYAKEFYKYTPRSLAMPIGLFTCVVLFQLFLNKEARENEEKIRSGNSTYAERARYSARIMF